MRVQPLQLSHRRTGLVILGQSGTGKTTYLARYLDRAPGVRVRFVFDPDGPLIQRLGRQPVFTAEGMLAELRSGSGWVLFHPGRMFPGANAAAFDFFARWAWEMSALIPGRKIFACDELQKWAGCYKVPPGLALVLDTGRQHGLDSAFIAQSANRIHDGVRSQTTELVACRLVSPRALEWISEIGMDADRIRKLPNLHFCARNLETGAETWGQIHLGNPPKRTRSVR